MDICIPDEFIDYLVNLMADERYDSDHDRWVEYAYLESNGFDVLAYPITPDAVMRAISGYEKAAPNWSSLPESGRIRALGRKLTDQAFAANQPLVFENGKAVPVKIELPAMAAEEIQTFRAIELRLRDRARSEAGLPPLTGAEKSNWVYRRKNFLYRRLIGSGITFSSNDAEKNSIKIADYIIKHYPEAVRYLKAVRAYGETLSRDLRIGVGEGRKILSGIFFFVHLDDATARVLGEEGCERTDSLFVEEIIQDKITKGEI